jgi:recombination associated protein RdgC
MTVKNIMWFKNVRAYRLTSPFTLTAEQLHELLQSHTYTPCGKTQPLGMGWVSPLGGDSESLVLAGGGRLLLCVRREEKLLPATVVREQLAEKVEQIEQAEGRKVYRKERLGMKDEIIQDCLPRAFSRSVMIYAYIDTRANWLFVDSSSAARAEEVINLLRESVGTLPLLLPQVNHAPAAVMTGWLQHRNIPEGFELAREVELREPSEEGGVVRCKGVELAGEEVDVHLDAGKQVVKLALQWDEKVQLVLAEDMCLRRLRFADELVAENEDLQDADPAARVDADFALMSGVITELQERLIDLFGGEAAE